MYCGFSEGSAGGTGASKQVQSGSSVTVYVRVEESSDEDVVNEIVVMNADTGAEIATIPVRTYKCELNEDEEIYYHYLKASFTVTCNVTVQFPW